MALETKLEATPNFSGRTISTTSSNPNTNDPIPNIHAVPLPSTLYDVQITQQSTFHIQQTKKGW